MKKIYLFLFLSALLCSLTFAQAPQVGKNYNIKNVGANLYLSYVTDDWNISRINEPSGDADQVWKLIATEEADVFNLSYDGQFLTKNPNNDWDNVLTSDSTAGAAKFVLTEAEGGITIKLLANRDADPALYYAPQQAGSGSAVYLNSSAANNWELWVFEEVVETEVPEVKTLTPNADAVEVTYNAPISVLFTKDIVVGGLLGITVKDDAGVALENVTATVLNARLTIQHANFTFGKTYTVTVPVGVIADYTQVITWSFTVANPVTPQGGKNYNIKNVGANLYLSYVTDDWNVSRINEPSGDADQVWKLIATEEADVFNLSYDGQYLTKNPNNDWDNVLSTDSTAGAAKFVLTETEGGITIQLLANRGTALYYAPQQASAGSSVYLNSLVGNNWELWLLEEVVEAEVLEVKTLTPNADAFEVAYNAPVTVLFTKDIVAGDLSAITIKDDEGVALENVTATVLNARLSIQHANFTFGKTYTVTVPVGAIADYMQEITWSFTVANPVLPVDPRTYIIKNATTGFYLTAPEVAPATDSALKTTNKIGETGEGNDPTQVFRFTNPDPGKPDVFNIAVSGKFLSKVANSAWASTFTEDPTSDLAKFVVTPEGVGVKIQALSQVGQYLAPNNLDIDIPCYFDKTANISWVLEQVIEPIAIFKTIPADNATGIAFNATVEGIFNQSVTAGNLTGVTIKDEAGVLVADVVATLNDYIISLVHADFDYETTYTVTIPQEAVEGLDGAISWSFTTKAGPNFETTSPTIDATNVAVNVSIKVFFTENVIAENLEGIVITDMEGNNVEGVEATLTEIVLSITHPIFSYDTEYIATIPVGTIKGIEEAFSWSFTTTTAPAVRTTIPENNASNIPLTTLIRISFDKTIYAQDLNGITVADADGNQVNDVVSITGYSLSIAHTALSNSTLYTVTVPANSIKGVTEEIKYSFTTEFPTGIDDVNKDADISVYPTVSQGIINVSTPAKSTVRIIDIAGVNRATYQSNGNLTINMDYSNGIYFIVVNHGNGISTHKVLLRKTN